MASIVIAIVAFLVLQPFESSRVFLFASAWVTFTEALQTSGVGVGGGVGVEPAL